MASLATLEDLEVRLGQTLGSNEDRAEAILADVSAAVRAYTGQQLDLVTDDTVRLRIRSNGIRLPQRPVVEVTAVTSVEGDSMEFRHDAGDTLYLAGFGYLRSFEVEPISVDAVWVDVTYTHGYETIPADIVGVVCQIAGRAFGRTPDSTGVTQESIAGYSYSVGSAAAQGAFGMLAEERRVLDRYRIPVGTIRVGL